MMAGSTRQAALDQLEAFLENGAAVYAERRNHVTGNHEGVSRLSPALRHRLITEDEVLERTLDRHPWNRVEKWVQEVWWRRYWKGWLEMRPAVWWRYTEELEDVRQTGAAAVMRRAEEVAAGRSGVAVMDAFARELMETGYLHNHARMWWASFWIHVERLPWQLGADFFLRHLLDGDAASNTLSWRWVAGLQTAGKTYLVRRSNLEKYVDATWLRDPSGLERLGDDRVEAVVPQDVVREAAGELPEAESAEAWTAKGRWGLWIHEDDLSADQVVTEAKAVAVSAPVGMEHDSAVKQRWASDLTQATEVRIAKAGAQVEQIDGGDLVQQLVEWARRCELEEVVAMRPFVGRLGDEVSALEQALTTEGVRLTWLRRSSDSSILPLAKKGFFPFWQKERERLEAMAGSPHSTNYPLPTTRAR
jgi:deoxyribodipyrimidine photolyase